jgi:hypothetical protein
MLQVKDMEFELVPPNFAHFQGAGARTSEDSGVLRREGSIDLRQDGALRACLFVREVIHPTCGLNHLRHHRCRPVIQPTRRGPSKSRTQVDVAHVVLACVAIAQVQKVKKLLLDGVPSSVRYLVWSYLTNGKARCARRVSAALWERESTCVDGCQTEYQEIFPGSVAPSRNARTGLGSPPDVFEHGSAYLVFYG